VTNQRAIAATQNALAVITALLDGTEGGNWDAAQSAVIDYTSDDAATADLMTGFLNLGMILVKHIALTNGQSTGTAVAVISQVVAGMADSG
jgi:hypothetical protein